MSVAVISVCFVAVDADRIAFAGRAPKEGYVSIVATDPEAPGNEGVHVCAGQGLEVQAKTGPGWLRGATVRFC